MISKQVLEHIITLQLTEATDYAIMLGFRLRQTNINGIPQICTRDYRLDRINVHVIDETIVKAYVG